MNPKYPVFIVSKGRWETRHTSKALVRMGVPHYIIVEPQEYSQYVQHEAIGVRVLVLPECYKKRYDTCDDLGDTKGKGPGPARNFAWEYSLHQLGHPWHWVMDDNIAGFGRINRNLYIPVTSGTIFRCAEDFVERYTNIAQAGFNYDFLAKTRGYLPAYVANTRIYSCLLIRNDIPFRWRGRYNEDTDLSLRCLKAGWCTVQFNAFIQEKATTQTVKGGNTAEFYEKEGTAPKSEMLEQLHPDVAKVVWRFNRWHHHVNYRPFKGNKLIRRDDYNVPKGVNNYGMVIRERVK